MNSSSALVSILGNSADASPSFIVRLRSPQLANSIISARKSYNHNYFSTSDLDTTILTPDVASSLPDCKIFVNEVLSTTVQRDYLSLKETAKRLGFRYVWHRAGRFLVRWREGHRAHAIKTPADISAILASIQVPHTTSTATATIPNAASYIDATASPVVPLASAGQSSVHPVTQ